MKKVFFFLLVQEVLPPPPPSPSSLSGPTTKKKTYFFVFVFPNVIAQNVADVQSVQNVYRPEAAKSTETTF